MKPPVFIVTGVSGSGKTTFLRSLYKALSREHIDVGGVLSEGTWKNDKRESFDLVDLKGGERIRFCQREPDKNWDMIGPFYINPLGQAFGEMALFIEYLQNSKLIIIDEIGPLELKGKGWAKAFEKILKELKVPIVISVREKLVDEVVEKWDLSIIHKVSPDHDPQIFFNLIREYL